MGGAHRAADQGRSPQRDAVLSSRDGRCGQRLELPLQRLARHNL
jgi:hypothetical protein